MLIVYDLEARVDTQEIRENVEETGVSRNHVDYECGWSRVQEGQGQPRCQQKKHRFL